VVKEENYEEENLDAVPDRELFQKPASTVASWVRDVASGATEHLEDGADGNGLLAENPWDGNVFFQFPAYEKFILESQAYQWLLKRIWRDDQLELPDSGTRSTSGMRTKIQHVLRAQNRITRISRRRPMEPIQMELNVDWNPFIVLSEGSFSSPTTDFADKFLCLTGSFVTCQATTVEEYMYQTWPTTGGFILELLQQLVTAPAGSTCSGMPSSPSVASLGVSMSV